MENIEKNCCIFKERRKSVYFTGSIAKWIATTTKQSRRTGKSEQASGKNLHRFDVYIFVKKFCTNFDLLRFSYLFRLFVCAWLICNKCFRHAIVVNVFYNLLRKMSYGKLYAISLSILDLLLLCNFNKMTSKQDWNIYIYKYIQMRNPWKKTKIIIWIP